MFDFFNKKSLQEAKKSISDLRDKVEELEHNKKEVKRIAEGTYLFTGDINQDIYKNEQQNKSDLDETNYWQLQKQCYDAFKIFPYAKRVIEMMTDFVIGSEVTYSVDEEYKEKITPIIDDFWFDYDNDLDVNLEPMVNELWVLGEQIYPVSIDPITKIVKIGIVDPRGVEKILRDKKNQKRLSQIEMQYDSRGKTKVYGVINESNGKLGVTNASESVPMGKEYAGDAFLFQVNRLLTQTRGYSELTTMLETLDVLDQFVFQVSERSLLLYQFIADILIKNKTEEEIKNFPVPDPRKNATFKHNQNVEMTLHTPDIKAPDAEKIVQMIIRYVLAGVGIPEHWIVNGGNANFATAKEQNNPIEKRLERKQGIVKSMLKKMIRFQIEQKGTYTRSEIQSIMKAVNIDLPSVAGVDRKYRAQVLTETAKALVTANSQGWITAQDAGQEFINLANKLGMELSAMHIDEANQNDLKDLTGKNLKKGTDIEDYFKYIDQLSKEPTIGVPE